MVHLVLVALLIMACCYLTRNAAVMSSALVAQIKAGQFTKEDAQLMFGAPTA